MTLNLTNCHRHVFSNKPTDQTNIVLSLFINLWFLELQALTSAFVDNPDMKSSEVGECHNNNALASPNEIQQSDTILEPFPSSGSSIPGRSRLETINLEANHSSVGTCEGSLAPSLVGSPGAQIGFPCTSVEVPGPLETGKDLIDAASGKHISLNINMSNAIGIKDVKRKDKL